MDLIKDTVDLTGILKKIYLGDLTEHKERLQLIAGALKDRCVLTTQRSLGPDGEPRSKDVQQDGRMRGWVWVG